MKIGRYYKNAVKVALAAIAGFAFIDGISSSIDFLTPFKSLILTIVALGIYVVLYYVQKKSVRNFKGNSKIINLGTLGIIFSFWLPLVFQTSNTCSQSKNNSNVNDKLSIKPIFFSKNQSQLNILVRPFKSQQSCNNKLVAYEKAIQSCLEELASQMRLPLKIEVLECEPKRSIIFHDSLLSSYSSSEERIIQNYELGLIHNADLVIDGSQELNQDDTLSANIKVLRITYDNFDHLLYNLSHDNASGLSNQYDIVLLSKFKEYTHDTTLSIGFLSRDVFVHAKSTYFQQNKLIGKSYFEIEEELCENRQWIRIVLSHLIKKYVESGRIYEGSKIYDRLLKSNNNYEMLYGDKLFSTWLLNDLEDKLYKNDISISELVDSWISNDKSSALSMNLRILKLRLLFQNPLAGDLTDYLNSLKESAIQSKENLATYILAKYMVMYLMKNSGFSKNEILFIANDGLDYNDIYKSFEKFPTNNIDLSNVSYDNSFFRLEIVVSLLNNKANFDKVTNSFINYSQNTKPSSMR